MNSTLESRKLNILEHLAELNDESIIQQIENLLVPSQDFWDELSEKEKELIHKGIKDLDNGDRVDFQKFLSEFRKK